MLISMSPPEENTRHVVLYAHDMTFLLCSYFPRSNAFTVIIFFFLRVCVLLLFFNCLYAGINLNKKKKIRIRV